MGAGEAARGWQPDWATFLLLLAVAVLLFARVGSLPDYDPAREAVGAAPSTTGGGLQVQDFAYILNYARRAVGRPGVSLYSVDEHRRFLAAWMGPHVGSALCFAYSPTAILVLAPLFPLPTAGRGSSGTPGAPGAPAGRSGGSRGRTPGRSASDASGS